MFRGRWFILAGVFGFLVMWGISNGFLKWHKDNYSCLGLPGWYAAVDKQRLFTVWRVQIYYQPLTYGCSEERRYDPQKYEVQNGIIVPRQFDN